MPFSRSAHLYDDIYTPSRDYEQQAHQIREWIKQKKPDARSVLDVACGTGIHLSFLKSYFDVAGLDVSESMIQIAKSRNPGIPFFIADMRNFDLDNQYDAIICMFSSITYAKTFDELKATIANFAKTLLPKGVCVVEPYIPPKLWRDGQIGLRVADSPDLKVTMVDRAVRTGRNVWREIAYTVGTSDRLDQFTEDHEFRLYSRREYEAAFMDAGFKVDFDESNFVPGRGMFLSALNT